MRRLLWAIFATLSLTAVVIAAAGENIDSEEMDHRGVGRRCGTEISHEQILESERIFNSLLAERARSTAIVASTPGNPTVPVYFHVITAGEDLSEGNIPDSQIHDQIRVLNEDFINSGLKFELKEITRTFNPKWFEHVAPGNDLAATMKSKLRRGDAETLNVYTVGFTHSAGNLGFTAFPENYASTPAQGEAVILYSTLPGGTHAPPNGGRTLTREVEAQIEVLRGIHLAPQS